MGHKMMCIRPRKGVGHRSLNRAHCIEAVLCLPKQSEGEGAAW